MQETEILEKFLNCCYLWKHIINEANKLLDDSKGQKLSAEYFVTAVSLQDEALELIQEYEDAVEKEKVYREKKEMSSEKLKEMLGDAEFGRIENRLVSWKRVRIKRFNETEFQENEPELYKDYTDTFTYREFSVE